MKTFYIFKVVPTEVNHDLQFVEKIEGLVTDARAAIASEAYEDGDYHVLEDTSGVIQKKSETVVKSRVTFTPPEGRRRERKAPAAE